MPNESKLINQLNTEIGGKGEAGTENMTQSSVDMLNDPTSRRIYLAQKAFALAIHERLPNLQPLAEDIIVTTGVLYDECCWPCTNCTWERRDIRGSFHCSQNEPDNQGGIFIASMRGNCKTGNSPLDWHFVYLIDEEYEAMSRRFAQAKVAERCPDCLACNRPASSN